MEPVTRCKMRVQEVTHVKNADGTTEQERIKLMAVSGPENAEWSKYTPWANFEIGINNPAAQGKLSKGHEYFVDFTPVAAE